MPIPITERLQYLKMSLEDQLKALKREAQKLIGRDCTILVGKFKGRKARVSDASSDVEGNVRVTVRPFKISGEGEPQRRNCQHMWLDGIKLEDES